MAEQSEERVTLWRWKPGTEPGIDHSRSIPGPQPSPWQEMGHIPAAWNSKCEVAEFVRVSSSPVDTDSCPTCGSKVRSETGGGYRLTQGGSCPDPWHSRSQAGEG